MDSEEDPGSGAGGDLRPGESAAVVAALAAGDTHPGGLTARMLAPVPPVAGTERAITVDQTHRSVVVGERVMVKWLRADGPASRTPGLVAHLAEGGFTRMPTPYAVLYGDAERPMALVTAYLPGARDGWEWCVEALLTELAGGPPADFAADLGRLAAELHATLTTPSTAIAEPVAQVQRVPWTDAAYQMLAEAVALSTGETDFLAAAVPRMRAELAEADRIERTLVQPVHADLHVGQVLHWPGGYAVTDFDGNPTVTDQLAREPAARDVAQLRTSLAHVAQIAHRRTGGGDEARLRLWAHNAAEDLLTAYRADLAARGLTRLLDERLLRPFEVEQECRELVYAARFLPRWRYAPMGVLRWWYG